MHDNFYILLAYFAKNNLKLEDLKALACDADDDLNGVNERIFVNYLNANYDNICKRLDKNIINGIVYKNINQYLLGLNK